MHTSTNGMSRGAALAKVSNGLVQIYARHCGKGPTRAKSNLQGDLLVCKLGDPFTVAEVSLLEAGEIDTVREMRDGFRRTTDAESRNVVTENLGRRVLAHMSTMHVDPDLAIEIFMLERGDSFSED